MTAPVNLSLGNNPINCDCHIYNFIRLLEKQKTLLYQYLNLHDEHDVRCAQPNLIFNTSLNFVVLGTLYCSVDCPENCFCRSRAVDQVIEVDCSNRSLDQPPSWLPKGNQIELLLSRNNIKNVIGLSPLMNSYNITKLSLKENQLENIDELFIPDSIQVIMITIS